MPALLYLQQQDEVQIQIDEDGFLTIIQKDLIGEVEHKINISPMYVDSFVELLQTVVKES